MSISVRHRKAFYPRQHREQHFTRKQMLAICEPIFPADKRLESEKCFNLSPRIERQIHPYDRLLAEDMKRELSSSRMICFFHQNKMTPREKQSIKNEFEHQEMYLRYYNPDVAQLSMSATKYESAIHLCDQKDVTILFSAKPVVNKLLKMSRKCPELILLAAIIDNRFLSVEDLKDYNRLPDLQTLRAQLSHTLSMATKSIADKTVHPISQLTNSLDLYINQQKK